ncbi:MAG: V-type ATP synthase subunit C [Firmicutes bacterium]|nr:V-type ATP synthase subunit C [Bacillota bacterium]
MSDQYIYAVGRIRVMETRLLDAAKINRMAEAPDAEEAFKVLGETEYAAHLADFQDVNRFEEVLAAEQRRVYLELRKMLPDSALIDLFAYQFDYHNLKVLLKAARLKENRDDLLIPDVGNIPLEELVMAVSSGDYSQLPERMRTAAEKITADFQPYLVDLWLDRALYEELLAGAKRLRSAFLQGYFTALTDLLNIKTFIRVKRLKGSADFLAAALLPGGKLDLLNLLSLEDTLEEMAERLADTPYAQVVAEGLASYQQTETLTRYEKLVDNYLLDYIKQAKYTVIGFEPVVGYLLAKENELKLIRIIMVGKINQLPVAEIRERLRDVYV